MTGQELTIALLGGLCVALRCQKTAGQAYAALLSRGTRGSSEPPSRWVVI